MEKKPERKREEGKGKGPDNEVRVTSTTFVRTYLAYIARLFEEKHDKVVIKAMGFAVPRAVSLAMLVRRRFKGLHQIVEIGTNEFTEQDRIRRVGLITITLSKKELDKNHIGYTAPLPDSEVTEYQPFVPGQEPPASAAGERGRGGRGRGRGRGRGGPRGGFRGRGRGRGSYEGGYGGGYEEDYGYEGGYEGGFRGRYRGDFGGVRRGGFGGGRRGGFGGGRRGAFGGVRRGGFGGGFGGGRRGGFRAREY